MFVLQKEFLFARGLNWDQSCLWKTPPSHFLLFSPLACPYFLKKFSSPDFWGVKEAPCKNLYLFGENLQRNQFPKLTTLWLLFHPCYNFAIVQWLNAVSMFWSPARQNFLEISILTKFMTINVSINLTHIVCSICWVNEHSQGSHAASLLSLYGFIHTIPYHTISYVP